MRFEWPISDPDGDLETLRGEAIARASITLKQHNVAADWDHARWEVTHKPRKLVLYVPVLREICGNMRLILERGVYA